MRAWGTFSARFSSGSRSCFVWLSPAGSPTTSVVNHALIADGWKRHQQGSDSWQQAAALEINSKCLCQPLRTGEQEPLPTPASLSVISHTGRNTSSQTVSESCWKAFWEPWGVTISAANNINCNTSSRCHPWNALINTKRWYLGMSKHVVVLCFPVVWILKVRY